MIQHSMLSSAFSHRDRRSRSNSLHLSHIGLTCRVERLERRAGWFVWGRDRLAAHAPGAAAGQQQAFDGRRQVGHGGPQFVQVGAHVSEVVSLAVHVLAEVPDGGRLLALGGPTRAQVVTQARHQAGEVRCGRAVRAGAELGVQPLHQPLLQEVHLAVRALLEAAQVELVQ